MKSLITGTLGMALRYLNILEDRITSQKGPARFDNVAIEDELKEEKMSFEDLVMTRGYPLEIHYVDTEDGYTLKLYRIPGGKNEKNCTKKQKQSVLIMHGIFDSSDGFVCNSEDKSLPFILANYGYDVWLGNNRGNKHSRNHRAYSPESSEFWNFSFHEMGLYDLPAFIDHILSINTFSEKLIYIGHSQGSSQIFAAMSLRLDYFKACVKLCIGLGPVANMKNMSSKFMKLLSILKLDMIIEKMSFSEIFSSDKRLDKFNSWIMPKVPSMCNLVTSFVCDENPALSSNMLKFPVYASHLPGGGSFKSIHHFVQIYRSGSFQAFNYGESTNLEVYHSSQPMKYDLHSINGIPIGLFSGKEDKLANPKDVEWLSDQLGENVVMEKVYENIGHTAFMIGNNIEWINDIIELMDLYI